MQLLQVILGKHLAWQIAKLHVRVVQHQLLPRAQGVFHHQPGWAALTGHFTVVFIRAGLH